MTAIKFNTIGGLAPSVDPRKLPPDGAQVAENLDMRYGDFRPTKGPGASVFTAPDGTLSIFRTPSGVWLTSTTDTDYVNGQINDAASERVYLTGRNAFPEVWQGGTYRRLGVPAPTEKPTVVLEAVDEFDSVDADAAQKLALEAALVAVNATATNVLLANAPPPGVLTPVPLPDPLYATVQLHLDFSALVSGHFVDKSPQNRVITHETGVTLVTDDSGPLGIPGAGCAQLAGGTAGGITFPEITRHTSESDANWTFDASIKPDTDLEFIDLEARDGNLREITFITTGGASKTLGASSYGGYFYKQLRAKRPDGSNIAPAGVRTDIRVQCTGTRVEVYANGVFCGASPTALGLELSIIGRSHWTNAHAFTGKIDEVRVSFTRRCTTDFTPDAPYSTAAVPTGFFVAHGDVLASGLPTTDARDAAYLVQLSLVSGAYVTTNPADEYLRSGALGGAQVTYSGSPYWAVPAGRYRANGKAMVEATLVTALGAIDVPGSPGTPLLTGPEAAGLGASIAALFNAAANPLLALVTAANSKQAELSSQLASAVGGSSAASTKISLMQAATAAIEAYFSRMDTAVTEVLTATLGTLFGSIASKVVNRNLEDRSYVVTYVTDWGEESATAFPSDLLEVDQNDAVRVTAPAPPPGRYIVAWRLYRSSSSNIGSKFQLVEDREAGNAVLQDGQFVGFDIGNLVYTDSKKQEELQETLQTLTWDEPPENLIGLTGMPNGIMVGFFGKTLCFSEPFEPYAWPPEYRKALEFDIVAVRVFGQTAVVLTEGNPYFASGADSASMSAQKVESPQACVSKRSAVAVEGGVFYASPDGLCLASPAGVQLMSQGQFNRADWLEAIGGEPFAGFHDGCYYLFAP